LVLSEYSHCLINFWKYEECEAAIREALSLLGLDIFLEGRMGMRTKWQHWEVAQLTLDIQTKDVTIKKDRQDRALKEGEKDGEEHSLFVANDEESILLEQPKFSAKEELDSEKAFEENLKKLETHEL
tara:strand:+ start:343 stop:723 length:381 start_codon:yes stop_codon:yes gene_type:complete